MGQYVSNTQQQGARQEALRREAVDKARKSAYGMTDLEADERIAEWRKNNPGKQLPTGYALFYAKERIKKGVSPYKVFSEGGLDSSNFVHRDYKIT